MVEQKNKVVGQDPRIGIVILVAVFTLPAIDPEKAGWLTGLIPAPVFYYLVCLGKKRGSTMVGNSLLFSGAIALFFGSLPLLIFSFTLLPLGFVFFQAAQQKIQPAAAGFKGLVVLGAAWLLFWLCYGLIQQINPYTQLMVAIDNGLIGTLNLYQELSEIPSATRETIQVAIGELRTIIPRVLPALLFVGLLYTVWINQALGNWLLTHWSQDSGPWKNFKEWQLPDKLIWGFIVGGISLIFFSGPLQTVGMNLVIVWGALYFLQGLAILIYWLQAWSLPQPVRIFIYGFVILQSLSMILLSVIGMADTWLDFRKLNRKTDNDIDHNNNRKNST